jgi:hypothetical protein
MLLNSGTSHDEDIGKLNTTLHHNWWDGSTTRNPRAGYGKIHVFNCLYNDNSYGIGLHSQCRVLIERNYFVDTNSCIKQMYRDDPEDEHHGFAEAVDNVFINTTGEMDDEDISFEVNDYYMYNFVLDPADDVQSIVQSGAGPAEAYATIGLMPIPGQGAVDVDSSTLSWKTGTQSADSYVVYFGTSTNPPQVGTTSDTSYNVGELSDGVIYYWRVDQVTSSGTVEGKLWTFRAEGAGEETDTEAEDEDTEAEDEDTEAEDDETVTSGPSADYTYCSDEGETCTYTGTVDIAYGADGEYNYLYNQSSGSIGCDNSTFGDPISGVVKACYVKPAVEDGDAEAEDEDTEAEDEDTETQTVETETVDDETDTEDDDTVTSGLSADYTHCSDEGETCTYTGTVDIAYGADGEYNYLYNQSSGSIGCDNSTFGDPIYGVVKACYVKPVVEDGDAEAEDEDTETQTVETETVDDETDTEDDDTVTSGLSADYTYCSDENETCTYTGTVDIAYGADGEYNYLYNQSSGSIDCDNSTFGDPIYGVVKACYVK